MIVPGIADSSTSGAALVPDGRPVAPVHEERLNRNKLSWGFPQLSIAEVMRVVGASPRNHHRCHAASAYYRSGLSTVITFDGAGDGKCRRRATTEETP